MGAMRHMIWGTALLAVASLSTATTRAADDKAKDAGEWVSLFDGETLSGWTMVELGRGESIWEVKDGAIVGSGAQSMLFSPKGDYKNFRFRAELKINDGGNSGMYIRTPKEATFTKGHEIQVNSSHKDPVRTGSVYSHVLVYKQLVPPDTWFTQEIEVVDRNYRGKIVSAIKVTVNDETLYEFLDYDREWTEGHFAFQQHDPGSTVAIRKVEVIELPETSPSR